MDKAFGVKLIKTSGDLFNNIPDCLFREDWWIVQLLHSVCVYVCVIEKDIYIYIIEREREIERMCICVSVCEELDTQIDRERQWWPFYYFISTNKNKSKF